jgi:hypothetical protein
MAALASNPNIVLNADLIEALISLVRVKLITALAVMRVE